MEIEVMRTGTWTDSSGKGHTFEASDLDRIVKAYAERQNDISTSEKTWPH